MLLPSSHGGRGGPEDDVAKGTRGVKAQLVRWKYWSDVGGAAVTLCVECAARNAAGAATTGSDVVTVRCYTDDLDCAQVVRRHSSPFM